MVSEVLAEEVSVVADPEAEEQHPDGNLYAYLFYIIYFMQIEIF